VARHRVIWAPAALADAEAIAAYIARDSVRYAAAEVERLEETAARLADFPHLGRMVREFGSKEIREVLVSRYRLIYRVEPAQVSILAIVHQQQDFRPERVRRRWSGA
jgi:addiction module RelE/StbE family toxin